VAGQVATEAPVGIMVSRGGVGGRAFGWGWGCLAGGWGGGVTPQPIHRAWVMAYGGQVYPLQLLSFRVLALYPTLELG